MRSKRRRTTASMSHPLGKPAGACDRWEIGAEATPCKVIRSSSQATHGGQMLKTSNGGLEAINDSGATRI